MINQTGKPQGERFQPIAVVAPSKRPLLFKLRCLVDLQLGTINKFLRPAMARLNGDVLDVGAGNSPWREYLPGSATYHGIDIGRAAAFGMPPTRQTSFITTGRKCPSMMLRSTRRSAWK